MNGKVGVWMIGAYGNVATCAVAGAAAVSRGLVDTTGLVTAAAEFRDLPLTPLDCLVFGGHEIREGSLVHAAREFGLRNGVLSTELRRAVAPELRRADDEIRPGVLVNPSPAVAAMADDASRVRPSLVDAVARIQEDLRDFQRRNRLESVVVVNLASTEPAQPPSAALGSLDDFRSAVDRDDAASVPGSVLYAFAALDAGFPFVDFTPAVATATAPVRQIAHERSVPFMGRDGKTGETLVKTVLAPMFVARNLRVLSWEGFNMLGNRDGEVLQSPGALESKVRDKDQALRTILGADDVHSRVRIDYVPSLGDWKQAYDFIHFQGFLGARMQMHFTWQGCDSALAAPLVLDLVRLTELARRRGESGSLPQLACFFKAPVDVPEQDFASQMDRLERWVAGIRATAPKGRVAGA